MNVSNLLTSFTHTESDHYFSFLGELTMPFGKYKGKVLCETPLQYLDETVGVMPKTWFVRRVIEFVDRTMESNLNRKMTINGKLPNKSTRDIFKDSW